MHNHQVEKTCEDHFHISRIPQEQDVESQQKTDTKLNEHIDCFAQLHKHDYKMEMEEKDIVPRTAW